MAAGAAKSLAFGLLFLNLILYIIVCIIAGWAIDYGITSTPQTVFGMSLPARLFPIYYPIGNMATGFFVVFALVAGLVGIATSMSGLYNIVQWNTPNLFSAFSSCVITWSLTLLAMGLACKEIYIGGRDTSLRALETLTIILAITQLFCTIAINSGVTEVIDRRRGIGG